MHFKSLLDLFKEDNWSNKLVGRITEILELAAAMFAHTSAVIVDGAPDTDPQVNIYDRDQRINKLERKIRRRVVSRLSVGNDARDVPSALIFMNVVKDGERLGDYIKNLHEVAEMMPENPDRELYRKWLAGSTAAITGLFQTTRDGFVGSDEALAGQVIKTAKAAGREMETAIRDITDSDLATRDAVCLVLVLRFYKRLVAHMSNIATTVVMPLDLIDFYDEPED
ncbi:hypothetical protein COW53_02655 [bacterium CG17_big_fil_post_rev_8_21_14_2_50_64_8]|nr:MAG: hypothetical protein COW53_02655 [bacterium CG17_big_fil_post_rev_8_21_14_2_50_64_8]PJA73824.1 MAG: hypothetical protein CO151_11945 [bacterium CG_4_9_14_3_um_filter_65_15]